MMAVVKANYVKRGRGETARAKATVRYITHRRGRDGTKTTRALFGFDGAFTKEQVYRMIDASKRGTMFYRLVVSPDPSREDTYKDLDLTNLTIDTMLALEERLGKQIQFVATEHNDHSRHRHTHVLVLVHGRRLTRADFTALRLEATTQALFQRQILDLSLGREGRHERNRGRGPARRGDRPSPRPPRLPQPATPLPGPSRSALAPHTLVRSAAVIWCFLTGTGAPAVRSAGSRCAVSPAVSSGEPQERRSALA